jgi:tRNA dimethylallyltransferase
METDGMPDPVIAVLGPTAAGKSDLALRLAGELGGEIINADSMQLYRGMDIGTAKLTVAQRQGIPHHLLDVWDVRYPANVAEYQRLARESIAEVTARGRVPILVGGSGLYLRAALDDLNFPGTDPAVRERLEAELAARGPAELHARLAGLDPGAATGILPSNGRRIVRALEVIELSGQPFTATLPRYESLYPSVQIGLRVSRGELDRRIAVRVAQMWRAGLVDEVRGLEQAGLREGRTASQALGYAQVLRVLAGEWDEDEAREQTVRATRRFARRQEAWFRRDPRVIWLDAGPGADLPAQTLATIERCHPPRSHSPSDSSPSANLASASSPRATAPRTTS